MVKPLLYGETIIVCYNGVEFLMQGRKDDLVTLTFQRLNK